MVLVHSFKRPVPMKMSTMLALLLSSMSLLLAACNISPPAAKDWPGDASPASVAARFEADRKSILAMAGEFEVAFQFDEDVPLKAGYKPHDPHRSGAFEFVEVLEDNGTQIVLQHVLVIEDQVIKHWRQDWQFERQRLWSYVGDDTWERRELSAREAAGTWTQTVWQVDDSPRYAGIGHWTHQGGVSSWTSEVEWRPLPRRELTTRKDYDKLIGTNRQTITPTGWVHEQDNLKIDRKAPGGEQALTHERGLNIYTRISGHDFSAGRQYWNETRDYWTVVRQAWEARFEKQPRMVIHAAQGDERLYQSMFEQASALSEQKMAAGEMRGWIDQVLDRFIEPAQLASASASP